MKNTFRILALGDIVGAEATENVCRVLPSVKRELDVDFTVANGENASKGNGLDGKTADLLLSSGIDVLTSGNHIWRKHDMQEYIESNQFVIRPANYPKGTAGMGYTIFESFGYSVLVMNVLGTTYMEPLSSPFDAVDEILEECKGRYNISILDVHAEATSEKLALAAWLDGRVSAVFGTHTHVMTADAKILPKGTGYITDIGMCGAVDSILGVKTELIIRKFRTRLPVRFENPENAEIEMNGAVFTFDKNSGKAIKVESFRKII